MSERPPGDPDPLDAETGWARIVEAIDGGVPIHVNRGEGERYAAAWVEGFDEGWSQASRSQRWPNLLALLVVIATAIAFGAALGWVVGTANAAPRSAPEPTTSSASPALDDLDTIPRRGSATATRRAHNPESTGSSPVPATTQPDANWLVRTGDASTYGEGWDGWTAIPEGPGYRIRVCGPADCAELLTTDAGPDQRIHPDRVVDLDVPTFEAVCGGPWRMGTCPVSVTILRVPHG